MKKDLLLLALLLFLATNKGIAQCDGFVGISAGYSHTLGIKADGTLWAWGVNFSGQLGDGTSTNRNTPAQIGSGTWKSIAAGGDHSLGIKADGTLWAWGANYSRQLGDGSNTNRNAPVQIGSGTWRAVAAGVSHSLGIKADGTLWAWGGNGNGQLGDGSNTDRSVPVQIGFDTWKAVAAGAYHSLGIKADGALWTWGGNGWGELGDGSYTARNTPLRIGGDSWKAIDAGYLFSIAIKADGTLWTWGDNGQGKLGDGGSNIKRNTPGQIGIATWDAIAAGREYSMGIRSDGTLWAWGDNDFGELGNGTNTDRNTPAQIGSDTWKVITAGYHHSLGIKADGALWAWGVNGLGELGNGTNTTRNTPGLVYAPAYNNALAVNGSSHTIATGFQYAIFSSNCNRIAALQMSQGNADPVTAKVWVAAVQPAQYVKRHYEIAVAEDAATVNSRVTLYFTNQEFKDFNNQGPVLLLPDADDPATIAARKAHLLIEKRSGISRDGSGLPATYTGTIVTVNPNDADIVWNSMGNFWEVSFNATGFSGFFVKTLSSVLPVHFGAISAVFKNNQLQVSWSTLTETNNSYFQIEVSRDGETFVPIAMVNSKAANGSSGSPIDYHFNTDMPRAGTVLTLSAFVFGILFWSVFGNRKTIPGAALLLCLISMIGVTACQKSNDMMETGSNESVFIRIRQVNKDGSFEYSKTVKLVVA
ncbi:RCC1 domain-containing protein [Niabella drilacis]|uniref:Alpha-tubulin suppressor n=1 Tax=Niabella drilacis (strain DSM 25811 / CCM 8410 / CCUG 62505 / LMG 26954 / E90) TaxID=1285928 RepID=A0A1G6S265_NIADE|nr:RCC1 domain-containing protein [Niabella drilacis]SDD10267.1 Alpha-tubulin suppressor [Niabella drilacis]